MPPLPLAKLEDTVRSGHVDTVLVTFTDMQGRLQGKRVNAKFFLDDVMHHGTAVSSYLLATDAEMNLPGGYPGVSWDSGYQDLVLRPDLQTLRPAPWLPSTAIVLCDVLDRHGKLVPFSPRQVLARQVEVLQGQPFGCIGYSGTELEFTLFNETYQEAYQAGYSNLTPANRFNVGYSILATSQVDPLLRDLRNGLSGAGIGVEAIRGGAGIAQHEITLRHTDVLSAADQHVLAKTAAKELATRHNRSATFMAQFAGRSGNAGHLHLSLRGVDGGLVFYNESDDLGWSDGFRSFLAGVHHTLPQFMLFYAPNINSYRRYQGGGFAPTTVSWGEDNRSCALRVLGVGGDLRIENRVPGADVNPYLALAAMVAGGLYGVEDSAKPAHERAITLPVPAGGDARTVPGLPPLPRSLGEARDLFAGSELAQLVFGKDVVDHYVHAADVELAAAQSSSSGADWERMRGFERL